MKPFAHQSSKINLSTVLLIFWFCTVLRCSVTCGRQLAVRISSNAMPRFFLPKLKFNKFNINLVWMAGMAGMLLIPQPWPVDRIGARAHGTQPPCRIHRNPSVLDSQETVQMVGLHQWFRTWCWTHSNSLIRLILKRRKDTKAQSSVFMVRNTLGMDSLRVLRYTTGLGKMFICMLDKPIVVKLATRWVFPWYLTHGKSRKPDRWSKKKRRENFFRKKGGSRKTGYCSSAKAHTNHSFSFHGSKPTCCHDRGASEEISKIFEGQMSGIAERLVWLMRLRSDLVQRLFASDSQQSFAENARSQKATKKFASKRWHGFINAEIHGCHHLIMIWYDSHVPPYR